MVVSDAVGWGVGPNPSNQWSQRPSPGVTIHNATPRDKVYRDWGLIIVTKTCVIFAPNVEVFFQGMLRLIPAKPVGGCLHALFSSLSEERMKQLQSEKKLNKSLTLLNYAVAQTDYDPTFSRRSSIAYQMLQLPEIITTGAQPPGPTLWQRYICMILTCLQLGKLCYSQETFACSAFFRPPSQKPVFLECMKLVVKFFQCEKARQ